MLTAHAIDAGLLPESMAHQVTRPSQNPFDRWVHYEKAGWIQLEWERADGDYEIRRVLVSRARALEAMQNLARERRYV